MLVGLMLVLFGACDATMYASDLHGAWHHEPPDGGPSWNLAFTTNAYTLGIDPAGTTSDPSEVDTAAGVVLAPPGSGLLHAGSWELASEVDHPDFGAPQPYAIAFFVQQTADPGAPSGPLVLPIRRLTDRTFDLYDAEVPGRWRLFRRN